MNKLLTTLCVMTHCVKDQNGHSVVPSAPSTRMVELIISKFFENTNVKPEEVQIIVGFDKRINRQIDEQYHQNLEGLSSNYPNYKVLVNLSNSIEAIVTATQNFLNVIFSVETETYTIWEHDRPAIRPFDFRSVIEEMKVNKSINYIRFNEFYNNNERYPNLVENGHNPSDKIPLIPTYRWSNTPHICRTSTFKNWFSTFVYPTHNEGGFVEGPLCELLSFYIEKMGMEETVKRFGTFVYGNWNDEPLHVHLNGNSFM